MAANYDRFRPGPLPEAVDWILRGHVGTAVDLGAGTGALARLLLERADEVIAVEPDDRMRAVLSDQVPGARPVEGRGESMPLPDHCADAAIASSSWHWMDPVRTLEELARVLAPGGVLGALWSGPDVDSPLLARAQALVAAQAEGGLGEGGAKAGEGASELASVVDGDGRRPRERLELVPGAPFDPPQHEVFRWDIALTPDDLVGLLGTFSSVITLPEQRRERLLGEARRLLRELVGVEGDATVDVRFRADAWRTRRHP